MLLARNLAKEMPDEMRGAGEAFVLEERPSAEHGDHGSREPFRHRRRDELGPSGKRVDVMGGGHGSASIGPAGGGPAPPAPAAPGAVPGPPGPARPQPPRGGPRPSPHHPPQRPPPAAPGACPRARP